MGALRNAFWPGNIRELEHVVERAVILSSGPDSRSAEEVTWRDWRTQGRRRRPWREADDPPGQNAKARDHAFIILITSGPCPHHFFVHCPSTPAQSVRRSSLGGQPSPSHEISRLFECCRSSSGSRTDQDYLRRRSRRSSEGFRRRTLYSACSVLSNGFFFRRILCPCGAPRCAAVRGHAARSLFPSCPIRFDSADRRNTASGGSRRREQPWASGMLGTGHE
jgi:hypothetical protein